MHNDMKLITRLCLAASLATLLAGCQAKQEAAPDLTFSGDSAALLSSGISAPATETTVALAFQSTRSWMAVAEDQAGGHAGWIVIHPAAGTAGEASVTITITANPSTQGRSGIVTITSEDLSKTIQVTQEGRKTYSVTELLLSDSAVELQEGDLYVLTATVLPTFADGDKTVTWSSSKPSVATVSDGLVTALAPGTTVIKASAAGLSASCTVTVYEKPSVVLVESITLNYTSLTLTEGDSAALTATVLPENATDKTVSWTTSDAQVATVSQSGVVTALKAGTAVITATAGDKTATCTLTVEAAAVPGGSGGENLDDDIDVDPWN